ITEEFDVSLKTPRRRGWAVGTYRCYQRNGTMASSHVGSTNPELLRRVAALWDNPAWREFFALYDPLVRAYCSVYRLDAASLDDLCQRLWVELARRMPSYQYDPGGSFRGWLRRLCHHRAIDFYRERRDHLAWPLGDPDQLEDQRSVGSGVDREGGD